jgi:hypothetical protein
MDGTVTSIGCQQYNDTPNQGVATTLHDNTTKLRKLRIIDPHQSPWIRPQSPKHRTETNSDAVNKMY